MHKSFVCLVLVGMVFAVGIVGAPAQSSQTKNGIIRGIIRDESKAEVPGVSITLSNLEKNEGARRVISNERGEYRFEAPPGLYEMKVELPGFQTLIVPDVRLKENETIPMDLTISVARRRGGLGQ